MLAKSRWTPGLTSSSPLYGVDPLPPAILMPRPPVCRWMVRACCKWGVRVSTRQVKEAPECNTSDLLQGYCQCWVQPCVYSVPNVIYDTKVYKHTWSVDYVCKLAELTLHGVDLKAMQREREMRQTKDKWEGRCLVRRLVTLEVPPNICYSNKQSSWRRSFPSNLWWNKKRFERKLQWLFQHFLQLILKRKRDLISSSCSGRQLCLLLCINTGNGGSWRMTAKRKEEKLQSGRGGEKCTVAENQTGPLHWSSDQMYPLEQNSSVRLCFI